MIRFWRAGRGHPHFPRIRRGGGERSAHDMGCSVCAITCLLVPKEDRLPQEGSASPLVPTHQPPPPRPCRYSAYISFPLRTKQFINSSRSQVQGKLDLRAKVVFLKIAVDGIVATTRSSQYHRSMTWTYPVAVVLLERAHLTYPDQNGGGNVPNSIFFDVFLRTHCVT